jgi:cytochrome c-type biogenesis protein CcmF
MIPELGNFAIILALCFVLVQACAPVWAYARKPADTDIYFQISRIAVVGQFIFLSMAMLCLIASFLSNDMSVLYVQDLSHRRSLGWSRGFIITVVFDSKWLEPVILTIFLQKI